MSQSLTAKIGETFAYLKSIHNYRYRETHDFVSGARVVIQGQEFINFSSNDYLGLASHPKIIQAAKQGLDKYGVGSTASSLICGYSQAHEQLEEILVEMTGQEAVLLFSSGYMANMACLSTLVTEKDSIFMDKLNHASLIDAGLISKAKLRRFPHLEYSVLARWLENDSNNVFIVSDALFSMDGDQAKLKELNELKLKHDAILMLDDAHGFGVFGNRGQGLVNQHADLLTATFGKAVGTSGAFVAASKAFIEYIIQAGRNYIYTTAISPAIACATIEALTLIQNETEHRENLEKNITYFKNSCEESEITISESNTQIQSLIIGEAEKSLLLSQKLKDKGLYVKAIRPPTVPENTSRLRISLSAAHTYDDINKLVSALKQSV